MGVVPWKVSEIVAHSVMVPQVSEKGMRSQSAVHWKAALEWEPREL